MFGFTKLSPQEKAERDIKLRIEALDSMLLAETAKRQVSLEASKGMRDELEDLIKG
jgi:hypothetical protein